MDDISTSVNLSGKLDSLKDAICKKCEQCIECIPCPKVSKPVLFGGIFILIIIIIMGIFIVTARYSKSCPITTATSNTKCSSCPVCASSVSSPSPNSSSKISSVPNISGPASLSVVSKVI